jgi:hypothetical protein
VPFAAHFTELGRLLGGRGRSGMAAVVAAARGGCWVVAAARGGCWVVAAARGGCWVAAAADVQERVAGASCVPSLLREGQVK